MVLNTLSLCIGLVGVILAVSVIGLLFFGTNQNTTDSIELLKQIRAYIVVMTFILIGLFGYVTTKQ